MTKTDTKAPMEASSEAEELSFGAAMEELEGILRRVESEETDIDELADELKRAAVLLETCRAKIRRADLEVSQIVQNLERPAEPAPEASSPEGEPEAPLAGAEPVAPASDLGETANLFDTGD